MGEVIRNKHDANCKKAAWALRDNEKGISSYTSGTSMSLYEMDKAEILMEFFQKMSLLELQELRDSIVFGKNGFYFKNQ